LKRGLLESGKPIHRTGIYYRAEGGPRQTSKKGSADQIVSGVGVEGCWEKGMEGKKEQGGERMTLLKREKKKKTPSYSSF